MTDFLGLGAAAIAACTLGILAGGTVKGVVGIGLPLVALPVMASFITVPKAIALLLLPSFTTSVWQTFHGGQFRASVRRLWPFLLGLAAGTWVSVRLLASFDAQTLYLILGAIVAVFAALLYRRLVFSVGPRAEPWAGPVVGAASGLVGGLSMLFGTIYAMYLSGLKLGKEAFVAAVALSNTWATIVLAAAVDPINNPLVDYDAGQGWVDSSGNYTNSLYLGTHTRCFGSWHAGGCLMVMGDGSTQFLSESMDLQTYRSLATRADGLPVGGFAN